MSRLYDAVVVGAGPAGSTVAFLLAEHGYDVAMVDRTAFPRAKPCGESLNPGAVGALHRLGMLDEVLRLPHERIGRWRIHSGASPPLEIAFPEGVWGVATDRSGLDAALFHRACASGAAFLLGRVCDLIFHGDRVTGVRMVDGTEVRGRMVVGADGLRSIVVRRLGLLRRPPGLRKLALTAHVIAASIPRDTGVLVVDSRGCAGMVNVGRGITNIVLVSRVGATKRGMRPEEAFDRTLSTLPFLADTERCSEVYATGPFDWPTRRVTAPGAVLVGDAAGYFDPFTGQGLCHALRSGIAVAEILAAAIEEPAGEKEALDRYQRWHAAASGTATRLQKLIECGVARPWLFGGALAILRRTPSLAQAVLAAVGDIRLADSARRSPLADAGLDQDISPLSHPNRWKVAMGR